MSLLRSLPVRDEEQACFDECWQRIAGPGAWWSGAERLAMVREARRAPDCRLCKARLEALSPNAVGGEHDHEGVLPDAAVEVVHRMRTDSGRLTRTWFEDVISAGLTPVRYVEMVGVVAAAVVMDTFSLATGRGLRSLPDPLGGEPTQDPSDPVVDDGAFVPIMKVPDPGPVAAGSLPPIPNIARSLALVPAARELFFAAFRPHYALRDMALDITRPQTELVAARVSATNQCFY